MNINLGSNSNILMASSNMQSGLSNMQSFNFKNLESYNSMNFDNSIVMKKLGTTSLKLELDSLKDLSVVNTEVVQNTMANNRYNIIGQSKLKKYFSNVNYTNNKPKNVFTEFNKKIMSTRGWGNDIGDSNLKPDKVQDNNLVYARHHTKQQVLRELGSSILNGVKIKLPRDRKVDLNTNI